MKRDPHSHKGENGKVAIIGGSTTIHGAPLFSALAAEASGVDLVYVALPRVHEQVARMQSLNFQVHPFTGDELAKEDVEPLLELLATMDCAVIGPGLSREAESLKVLQELISSARCPLVLDASALQPWTLTTAMGKAVVLTPHLGELERMGLSLKNIQTVSTQVGATIVVKSAVMSIASHGTVTEVTGGNAGLTVGGTGDALAGFIAGLMSQRLDPFEAARTASTIIKRAAEVLFPEKGFAFGTRSVIELIPHLLHAYER